jgi:hypothetical protein
MRGKFSLLMVAALLACNGSGEPERGAVEAAGSALVLGSGGDVFPPPSGSQAGPALGFDGAAHLVVWSDGRGGMGQDLYAARVSKAGVVLGSEPIVISAAAGDEVGAAVAFDGANYLVVWQDQRGSTGRDIYGARVSPDGTVLDPGGFAISSAPEHQVEPAVAFDGTSYLVVWETRQGGLADVRGARVSPDGAVLASGLLISGAPLHQTQPAVACASGACLVAWRDGRTGGPDVYGARVSGATVVDPDGLPISRAGSSQGRPSIASDGSGYLVVWNDTRSGTGDVYGTRVSAVGEILDPSGLGIASAADAQQAPDVGFEGAYYVVAWHDRRSGAFEVYAARVSGAGAVLDPSGFLVAAGSAGVTTSVCPDGAGGAFIGFDAVVALDELTSVTRVRTQAITIRAELTVSRIGNGAGSVVSDPAGLDCGEGCTAMFDAPTVVTLTPSAAPGSAFVGWSGACTEAGLEPCTLTVDASQLAVAKFSPLYALTVVPAGTGGGVVTSEPAGIDCGAACTAEVVEGTLVTLSAVPDVSSVFAGWSGACSGNGSCVVSMDAAQTVTATFVPAYRLTVSTTGGSPGTVSGGATGPVGSGTIACSVGSSAGCSTLVAKGDAVTLSAAPGQDAVFKGWSGACTGLGDCTFAMSFARSVTASFQPATYAVKVATSGGGVGTIVGEGISCTTGSTTGCTAIVDNTSPYQVLTLTATPDANSIFKSWTGCTTWSGTSCSVTVSSAKNVTAVIQPSTYLLSTTASGVWGGGGTIAGPGIGCTTGSTAGCSAAIDNGATVTLTATPNASSVFKRWIGCSSSSGATCTVTMTSAKSVTAYFEPAQYALSVTASGLYGASGTVTGPGIGCTPGATTGCSTSVANGDTITLVAEPAPGSFFKSWTGCTSVIGATCTVSMTSPKTATASFQLSAYALKVSISGLYGASGTVTGPGIDCAPGATTGCSTSVANGDTVTLVAQPAPGSFFKSWSGCTSVSGATCTVSMTSPKTATASFQMNEYPLSVSVSGASGASGTVTGPGISCTSGSSAGCSTYIANGATVTLVAEPAPGSLFKSWVGCSSTVGASCTVTMTTAKTATATFMPSEYPLNVSISGLYGAGGTVTGPGISCTSGSSTGCSTSVANGASVTLVAEPAPGSFFKSWSGCTSVSGATCTVSMTGAKTATAAFQLSEYPLNVSISALNGSSGTVIGPGISCTSGSSAGCSTSIANGDTVTLAAEPAPGSVFKSWSGCSAVNGTTCSVTMTGVRTATATFQPATYTLTVTTTGLGHGTVSGPGIQCVSGSSGGCTAAIDNGATVTLTAVPNSTCDTFAGWSGGGCTGTGACTLTMTAAKAVSASFASITPPEGAMCLPVIGL